MDIFPSFIMPALRGFESQPELWNYVAPFIFVFGYFALQWYPTLFPQTFLYHRYFTHRMFKMKPGWEKCFLALSFLMQGASYFSLRPYVIMHRMHHAHSDEERDPHSPRYFSDILSLAWSMKKRYWLIKYYREDLTNEERETYIAGLDLKERDRAWCNRCLKPIDERFLKDLPPVTAFDRFASSPISRSLWGLAYAVPYVFLAQYLAAHDLPWFYWLLLGFAPLHSFLGAIQGTIVNWFGHSIGYTNFKTGDDSTNCALFWDLFLAGELYQNNHHHAASDPNFAKKKWEFDPMYAVILLFNFFGIIRLTTK